MSRRSERRPSPYPLYLIPGLVGFALVVALPFGMNLGISFTQWYGVGTPEFVGVDNYRELLADGTFWASFGHNLALVLAMAVVPTGLGLLLAAALFDVVAQRHGARTAALLRACFYLPQVLPIAVAGIVWSWILAPDGALNAALGRSGAPDWLGDPDLALWSVAGVMVWVQLGFPLVVLMAGLQRLDPALSEAGQLDGAGWWQRFWHLTVPQIRPETAVVLLWCTIAALKAFAPVYVLTKGGPGGATTVPAYFSYQSFFEKTEVGSGAAIATVLTLVILALTVLFLRVQGQEP